MAATLIISDVHANPWALDAVFADARAKFSLSEIWFLGDLFGYGPDPYKVWNKLCNNQPLPLIQLAGNHDWGFVRRIDLHKIINGFGESDVRISHYRLEASQIITRHQQVLKNKIRVWNTINSIPAMVSPRPGIYLSHGKITDNPENSIRQYTILPPGSPSEMVSSFINASKLFPKDVILPDGHNEVPPMIFAFGHTHEQKLWSWHFGKSEWQNHPVDQLKTIGESPVIFNPGSVGFSRDKSGCPSYAVIDWDKQILSFHHVWYDTNRLVEAMSVEPYIGLVSDHQFFVEPHCQENS